MAWKDSLEENNIEESGGKKSGGAKSSKRSIMPTLLIGLWLVALTVLLVFLFIKAPPKLSDIKPTGNVVTKKINPPDAGGASDSKIVEAMDKMNDLDKKIVQVESHIKNLENNIGERIAQIEKQNKDFEMLVERVDKLEATVLSAGKAKESEKLPEKVTEAVKPDAAPTEAVKKEPSEPKPSISEEPPKESMVIAASERPEKRKKTAGLAGKKHVAQVSQAKAKKRTTLAKVVKKRKPVRSISRWIYRDPVQREAVAAAYWLKRNRPDYSPDAESEDEPLYERRTIAEASSSDYPHRKNELPVETVSDLSAKRTDALSSGFQPLETRTETYLQPAETNQRVVSSQIPGVKYYQIREGETIDDIGKRYNMSSKEIKRMNRAARGASSFQSGEQIQVLPDGGFDHVGPRASLNNMGRKYDSLYGMSENEISNIGKLAPGLGIYADWDLY